MNKINETTAKGYKKDERRKEMKRTWCWWGWDEVFFHPISSSLLSFLVLSFEPQVDIAEWRTAAVCSCHERGMRGNSCLSSSRRVRERGIFLFVFRGCDLILHQLLLLSIRLPDPNDRETDRSAAVAAAPDASQKLDARLLTWMHVKVSLSLLQILPPKKVLLLHRWCCYYHYRIFNEKKDCLTFFFLGESGSELPWKQFNLSKFQFVKWKESEFD